MAAAYQWLRGWCVSVSAGFVECVVCVEGGGVKVVFEEIPRQLENLLGGSNMVGLLKIWIKGKQISLRLRGMQRREYLGSELVCLTCQLCTVSIAPSRVSRMRTILRRCSKIFCSASHRVGYNKLCGIYLIFRLDLNYIMGS